MDGSSRHTTRSTLAACVASLLGVPVADVPLDEDAVRLFLGRHGLGLVPVADPGSFSWAGPWIGLRAGPEGEPLASVMFGVPSGPVFELGGGEGPVLAGWVLAPLDVALWSPAAAGEPGNGIVEAVFVAPDAGATAVAVEVARAVAGRGLEGDRYFAGTGTFGSGRPGSDLTLIDAAVLDGFPALDHRRNVVVRGTDLNALVGREFAVGEVRCRGERLAEPCAVLDRANQVGGSGGSGVRNPGGGVLRPLVHRAGLRATILQDGTIRVGDVLTPA